MRRKEFYIQQRLLQLLVASMVSLSIPAGAATAASVASERPALVLNLVVDGLDREYVEHLMQHFGEGGLRKLFGEGVVFNNVDFGTSLPTAAATSVLMTGASPQITGITSDLIYNPEKKRPVPAMYDENTLGNFTDETYSPVALRVSTIADELKIAGGGTSQIFSIAPDPSQSIILAGHSGNNAVWLSDRNANWATSTYYRDVPTVISYRNRLNPLSQRIDTMTWQPSAATLTLPLIPEWVRQYPFKHTVGRDPQWKVVKYKNSPLYNNEATAVAREYLSQLALGKHGGTDMLSVAYSVEPYLFTKYADSQFETADAYIKLDRDVASLLSEVDRTVGLHNTIVLLAATPPEPTGRREDPKWRLPHGEYSPRKAMSLLNLYLIALHGNGEWVSGYYDRYFYLNRDLIKERQLTLADIQRETADFLKRMAGITEAYTIGDILDGHAGENPQALRRNTSYHTAGDVLVEIAPGWEIVETEFNNAYTLNDISIVTRGVAPTASVVILAPGVEAREIDTPVDARSIAPTMARLLRIRSPNGASLPPVKLK